MTKFRQPGMVKQVAVDNFLMSVDTSLPKHFHEVNAERDARIYKWNVPTFMAIIRGIERMYDEKAYSEKKEYHV